MNAQSLLDQYFEVAFSAPEGVKRLRELILNLAMRGLLVPQDPTAQPARELLREIEAKKDQLIRSGKLKKVNKLPEISPEEIPYKLPESWEWSRLGNITQIIRGITFPSTAKHKDPGFKRVPCLRTANVQIDIEWSDLLYIDESYITRKDQIIAQSDIVMSMANSKELVGKVAIVKAFPNSKVTFGGFLSVIRVQTLSPYFVLNFLCTSETRKALISSSSQTTNIANISLSKLNPLLVPIPPLEEQKRIVEKVDRLMEQCDRLEQLHKEREQKQIIVHAAACDRLLNAKGDRELQIAWEFLRDRFGDLYAVKENISELRKAILQLAIMGKLVPQDPNDPPASELLKEIRAEKKRLLEEGKIKNQKKFSVATDTEKVYEVPKNWQLVRLGNILVDLKYGTSKKCEYIKRGIPVLRIPNLDIESGEITFDDLKYAELNDDEVKELSLLAGDLLMIRSNGSASLVGRAAIIYNNLVNLAYAGYLIRLRTLPQYIHSRYLYLALNTTFTRRQIEDPIRTTSGVKNINSKEINSLIFSLPPIPEQYRIVDKVDQLMELCDQLESKIDQQTQTQTRLLNTLMAELS